MGQVLKSDAELRFPHIQIVNASAGSGKTHLLASRYVQFLLSQKVPNSELPNIIAITFTNKATGEMQRKILKILKSLALYGADEELSESKSVVDILTGLDGDELKHIARQKVNEIVEHFTDFQVKTIDSFVNSIIKSSAYDIGLPPDFNIVEDKRLYIELALDSLLFKAATDQKLLDTLSFLLKEGFVRVKQSGSWHIRSMFLKAVRSLLEVEFNTGMELQFIDPQEKDEIEKEIRRYASKLLGLISSHGLQGKVKKRAFKALNEVAEGKFESLSSRYFAKSAFEIMKNKATPPDGFVELYERFKELRDRWAFLMAHAEPFYYKQLSDIVKGELEQLKQRKKMVFIDELNIRVMRFMEEIANVPTVFFLLGERIYHFLIDEFQDTSTLQWNNLRPIIEETLSKGGSLFAVGDRKQLLFRFRGSDYELFKEASTSFPSVPQEQVYLASTGFNWRSRRNIVEFNNRVFSNSNVRRILELAGVEYSELSDIYDAPPQAIPSGMDRDGGFVHVEVLSYKDAENREEVVRERLVSLLKDDILNRFEAKDVVILVRKNVHGEKIAQWLVSEGIPVASQRSLDIRRDPLMAGLLSFLKFLDTPADNIAFLGAVLNDIFLKPAGLDRAKLISWLESRRFELPMPESGELLLFEENPKKEPVYVDFRRDFRDVWDKLIDEFFNNVGYLPPYDLVNKISRKWRILENFPHLEAHLMHLLELLRTQEESGGSSLSNFIEALSRNDEKFYVPAPEELDAVRIMTVHKAKGLEFRVAVVPFAEIDEGRGGEGEKENIYVRTERDGVYLWKRISKNSVNYEVFESYGEMVLKEKAWSFLDELNVLYVAMTRPKDELYVFVNVKDKGESNKEKPKGEKNTKKVIKDGGRLLRSLIFDVFGSSDEVLEIGRRVVERPEGVRRHAEFEPVERPVRHWAVGMVRESIPLEDVIGHRFEAIRRGEFIHKALSLIDRFIDNWSRESLEKALKLSLRAALSLFPEFKNEIEPIAGHLAEKILEIPEAKDWFLVSPDSKVFCEKEIIDAKGKLLRIDRLILTDDSAVIIEYKTGEPFSDAHVSQLRHYMRTVSRIYPNLKVKGYLFYLDEPTVVKLLG